MLTSDFKSDTIKENVDMTLCVCIFCQQCLLGQNPVCPPRALLTLQYQEGKSRKILPQKKVSSYNSMQVRNSSCLAMPFFLILIQLQQSVTMFILIKDAKANYYLLVENMSCETQSGTPSYRTAPEHTGTTCVLFGRYTGFLLLFFSFVGMQQIKEDYVSFQSVT